MHTVTDDELKRRPHTMLEDAARGEPTVVTAHGQVVMMTMPLNAAAPVQGALVDLAVTLFEQNLVSLGRAACIAGLGHGAMIDELGRRQIAVVRYSEEELARELAYVGTLSGRG